MTSLIVTLAATIVALAGVIWSGATRRRSLHYQLIVAMLTCLGLAIWRAEVYGSTLVFDGLAGTLHTVHMVSVALTFLCLPFLVVTGVRLARAAPDDAPSHRAAHHKSATTFALLVLVTAALGTAMTVLATSA